MKFALYEELGLAVIVAVSCLPLLLCPLILCDCEIATMQESRHDEADNYDDIQNECLGFTGNLETMHACTQASENIMDRRAYSDNKI